MVKKRGISKVACQLSATVVVALLAAACGSSSSGAASGGSNGKTVSLTFGVSATAPGGNMLQLAIAETEGYFTAEKLDVKTVFLGTSGAVVQAIAAGKIQIGTSTPDLVLQAIDKGQKVKMFYNWTTKNVTQFGVLPDGPIHSIADLKGKTVGVQSLSAGPAQLARAAAVHAGLDPAKDLKLIAVGTGAPALDALQRHRVDALITYDTLFSAMTTGTGTTLRFFPPEGVDDLFSSSFVASTDWLKNNPKVAAGFGRAWAKASVFAQTNPQAGVKMMFTNYPNSKVGASDEAATQAALAQFNAREQSLYSGKPPATQKWGTYPEAAVQHWIEYESDQKLLKTKLTVANVYTNEFVKTFNQFDTAQITKAAKSAPTS